MWHGRLSLNALVSQQHCGQQMHRFQASPRVMSVAFKHVLDRSWQSLKTFLPPNLSTELKVDADSALNPAVKQQSFMWNWRVSLDRACASSSAKRWKAFSEKTNLGAPRLSCKIQYIPLFSEKFWISRNHISPCKNHYKTPFPMQVRAKARLTSSVSRSSAKNTRNRHKNHPGQNSEAV